MASTPHLACRASSSSSDSITPATKATTNRTMANSSRHGKAAKYLLLPFLMIASFVILNFQYSSMFYEMAQDPAPPKMKMEELPRPKSIARETNIEQKEIGELRKTKSIAGETNIRKKEIEEPRTKSAAKTKIGDCVDPNLDHFRYRGKRLNKDVIQSNEFLLTELRKHSRTNGECNDPVEPMGQLIVGRFGASEQHLMDYADLPSDTTAEIPSDYVNPGYYFLPEEQTSFEVQRALAQTWGKQRQKTYASFNAFGLFDWDYRPDQIHGVEQYAPGAAWLHADVLYPPCFPTFKTHLTYDVPWTEALRNKKLLIVHPFIDTIQQQIPKLPEIWSKVNVTGAPSSCMPLERLDQVQFIRARLPVADPTQSWLEVLEELKQEITNAGHFDVALISCGGFGLPLLAHVASLPHKPSGLYMGGALQLFFGIHGARWYSNEEWYQYWHDYYTEAWTWPLESDLAYSTIGLIEASSYVKPGQAQGL